MFNYKMTITYDGTKFNGWQKQGNTDNTIQGKLNEIISKYIGEEVDVAGSGRTDKGVHARGQIANFKTSKEIECDEFLKDINSYLPQTIRVIDMTVVDDRFHSRLSAVSKTYEYIIDNGKVSDVFAIKFAYRVEEKLDVELMKEAASKLVGTLDFISFCGNKHFKKSSVRTITSIIIKENNGKIVISYTGNGFLQNMVRIMTGTLIEVGRGNRKPHNIAEVLEGKDRELAGFMAPPQGLFLDRVEF